MGTYKILSIDGGGVRGIYAAVLIERLAGTTREFLSGIDLIGGTSTGGIIALGLAAGMSPRALADLYKKNIEIIFEDSFLDDVADVGGLTGAEYSSEGLKKVLKETFGGLKLKDLGKRVIIPAFDLDNMDRPRRKPAGLRTWKPKFFHNFPGEDSDGEELVVDVAMRTTAAPTYFPTYQGYIDGGIVANNPSMAALAQALDAGTGNQALGNLRLLSVSTGRNPMHIEGQNLDWGYIRWAQPIIDLIIDGCMGVADYQCRQLLGDFYFRLDPILTEVVKLDEIEKAPELLQMAGSVAIADAAAWIEKNFA